MFKKFLTVVCILLLFSGVSFAQDVMTTTNDQQSISTGGTDRLHVINYTPLLGSATKILEILRVNVDASVQTGDWVNAIVGRVDYGSGGSASGGMVAPIVSELSLPPGSIPGGAMYVMDLEVEAESGFIHHANLSYPSAYINVATWGNATAIGEWEANAQLLRTDGFTDATGNMFYKNTLKVLVEGTQYYLPLSSAEGTFKTDDRIEFEVDPDRTGEGTYLFANGLAIGMATPGDAQGIKMEFDYGVSPTLSGSGKGIHGMDIKMTMDYDWDFSSANRNATVRGARIQGYFDHATGDVGGRVMGMYVNARAQGDGSATPEIKGIIGGTDDGPGIVAIEARTELGTDDVVTTPAAVGLLVFHNSKTGSSLDGEYRAIQLQQPLLPTTTGNQFGIWFGDDNNTGYPYDYAFGFSSELDLDRCAHFEADQSASGMSFSTIDGWIRIEIDGQELYLYAWDVEP